MITEFFGKISLKTALILPFLVEIVVTVGLVGWLSFQSGEEAVNALTSQLRYEVTARIQQHLKSYLSTPPLINRINHDAIHLEELNPNNIDQLKEHLRKQMMRFEDVNRIYFTDQTTGYTLGIIRDTQQLLWYEIQQQKIHYTATDSKTSQPKEQAYPTDPRLEGWYRAAITSSQPTWTPVYLWLGKLSFDANHPVYDDSGKLLGVLGVSMALSDISAFLQSLTVSHSGFAFIIEETGLLVAASTPQKLLLEKSNGQPSIRIRASASENPFIQRTADYLLNQLDLKQLKTTQQTHFELENYAQFLQITPLPIADKINWFTVVVVPEQDFMQHIYENLHDTLILFSIALIVAIIIGLVTTKWIMTPILHLNQAAQKLSQGQWQAYATHRKDELGQLAHSFNSMAKQLQRSFTDLENKNAELKQLHRFKDEFLAKTTHELRTPLYGIIGISEALMDGVAGKLSPLAQQNLAMVVSSSKRLSNLINDIIDFSQIKHGQIDLHLKPIGIWEAVEIVLTLHYPIAYKKGLVLSNQVNPKLPPVHADEERLQQILHNLVENAIKFTDAGKISITAEIIQNQYVQVKVQDSGMGMSPDDLQQLIESFEQNSPVSRNMGLGLAITQQLVTLHGGQLEINSVIDESTNVCFTLPISDKQSIQPTEPIQRLQIQHDIESLPAISPANTQNKHYTIMVVDDEIINLHVIVNQLSLQRYDIIEASSGVEALKILEQGIIPDLILLDVMMPQMTGYQVTQEIRKTWRADELPIVLLTAKNQLADLVHGLQVGANDYLTKPVSKDELLARVKTHIRIKELQRKTLKLVVENEKRLNQFLEAIPVGVAVFERGGKPYFLNHNAQILLGKGVELEAIAENLTEIYQLYVEDSQQLYPAENFTAVRALNGESSHIEDIEIHRNSGNTIPIEVWGNPIVDERGQVDFAVIAFQDITERKHIEDEKESFIHELFQLQKAYERFVPKEFLNLLGKKSIIDVQLGDQIQQDMTILSSDIRGFTTISEKMTSQETFDFINAYLGQIEPMIHQHHGVIDKYIGDAVLAVFPTCADDAIQGSIAMLKALEQHNQMLKLAGYDPIQIGIGLNTGRLTLGMIGGQRRIDGTVIADAVNVAARVEGLTKEYGVSLLITQQTYLTLKNLLSYKIRIIDHVKVKGKSTKLTVYEVFDADSPENIELKIKTLRDFEQGFMCFQHEKFDQARNYFGKVLEANEHDKPAQIYFERCKRDFWQAYEKVMQTLPMKT